MIKNDTIELKKKQTFILVFNIALIISSFLIALVALPYEIFFVVAIVILFALREIEKDMPRSGTHR